MGNVSPYKYRGGKIIDTRYKGGKRNHLGYLTPGPQPYRARLTVKECCAMRGISLYQVATSGQAQGTVSKGTVYRLARGDTSRIDLPTLATIAGIIATLSGQPVEVSDLMTLEESGQPETRWQGSKSLECWKAGR